MDWSLYSISAAPLLYFIYVQSHVNLSTMGVFSRRCGKTTLFETWKVVSVCFPAVYSLLFSSTHRCRGVTDELIWGSGVLLIDSWSDPASVVQYSLHQQMTPPGKWMGPLFFGPFSNERERSALEPSSFFRTTFQRGLKVCILRCKLWHVDQCYCVLHLVCVWIWFRWRNLDVDNKVRPQTCTEWIC